MTDPAPARATPTSSGRAHGPPRAARRGRRHLPPRWGRPHEPPRRRAAGGSPGAPPTARSPCAWPRCRRPARCRRRPGGAGAGVGARAGARPARRARRPDRLRPPPPAGRRRRGGGSPAGGCRAPGQVVQALVASIIEQKVTGKEAFAGYRRLVRRFGEPAPGAGRGPRPRRAARPARLGRDPVVGVARRRGRPGPLAHRGARRRPRRPARGVRRPARRRRPGPGSPHCPASAAGPGPRWRSGPSGCPTR